MVFRSRGCCLAHASERAARRPEATDAELDVLFGALGLTAHREHFPGNVARPSAPRRAGAASGQATCWCSTSPSCRSMPRSNPLREELAA